LPNLWRAENMKNILKNLLLILLGFAALQVLAFDFTYTKHSWFGAGSEGNEYALIQIKIFLFEMHTSMLLYIEEILFH
jgi:hypothetical protein